MHAKFQSHFKILVILGYFGHFDQCQKVCHAKFVKKWKFSVNSFKMNAGKNWRQEKLVKLFECTSCFVYVSFVLTNFTKRKKNSKIRKIRDQNRWYLLDHLSIYRTVMQFFESLLFLPNRFRSITILAFFNKFCLFAVEHIKTKCGCCWEAR